MPDRLGRAAGEIGLSMRHFILAALLLIAAVACDTQESGPVQVPGTSPAATAEITPTETLAEISVSGAQPTAILAQVPTRTSAPERAPAATSTPLPTPEPPPPPVAPGSAGTSQGLFIGTSDLPALVKKSSLIIVGTIDDSKPREDSIPSGSPSQRSLVRVYDVNVEQYLKGEGDEVLSVIQYDGIEHVDPLDGKVRQSRYPSSEILPTRGDSYVLFLKEHDHASGLWQLPARPYKFRVWFGRVAVESPVGDVAEAFPQIPVEEFISRIETLVAGP